MTIRALFYKSYAGPMPNQRDYPDNRAYSKACRARVQRLHESVAMREGFMFGCIVMSILAAIIVLVAQAVGNQ